VQDVLANIDVRVGQLLDALDTLVGAGRYVVAFSSDHGVPFIPEQEMATGRDAGRISSTALRRATNAATAAVLGVEGDYVAASFDHQIALVPGVYEAVRRAPGGLASVTRAITEIPGVRAAWSADDMLDRSGDWLTTAMQRSYVPGRSGDLMVSARPGWVLRSSSGTTHGTANDDDRRVPVVFYGAGVRAGRYDVQASPADIAPTLAALAQIVMRRADGRVLTEGVAR
jgi:arylsulfatase A-like enzyme